MVMRVQLVAGEYKVVLPPEAVEQLQLKDGDPVEIKALPEATRSEHRTMTLEEGMEIFRRIEPQHREAFRELAK
jgi:hypothetical protein